MAERQLDKLLRIAAQENKLTKHELFIKGEDLTFWSRPVTIAEYNTAKTACKDQSDKVEATCRLFVSKALTEGGEPQYQPDALPVLLRQLSLSTSIKILAALEVELEEDEELDMKSDQVPAKKGKSAAS